MKIRNVKSNAERDIPRLLAANAFNLVMDGFGQNAALLPRGLQCLS